MSNKIFAIYERQAAGKYVEIERVSRLAQVDVRLQTLRNANPRKEYIGVWGDVLHADSERRGEATKMYSRGDLARAAVHFAQTSVDPHVTK